MVIIFITFSVLIIQVVFLPKLSVHVTLAVPIVFLWANNPVILDILVEGHVLDGVT